MDDDEIRAYGAARLVAEIRASSEDPEGHEDWDTAVQIRIEENWGARPLPTCCQDVEQFPVVQLAFHSQDLEVLYHPDRLYQLDPVWVAAYEAKPFGGRVRVVFCPFCGAKLPAVRLKATPPSPLCKPGMDYCETCGERMMTCLCYPPEAAYEVVA